MLLVVVIFHLRVNVTKQISDTLCSGAGGYTLANPTNAPPRSQMSTAEALTVGSSVFHPVSLASQELGAPTTRFRKPPMKTPRLS
ncbi:hypothetical protein SKAU_G00249430 [Synaphobranchus kaupii]|uniref:Uncharacterized protein n=1 Tax=Synaphobranchus kaupii TaxID=118154 RepID=A0A9Q1F2J7_SYNKA|nr:hypothetical protein SKAU_G00249430 [Synaphobranchus kaupii]